jgi:YHS domain-containing protein
MHMGAGPKMVIMRLVVLAVLLYIGWILLRAIRGRRQEKVRQGPGPAGESKVQDVLVEDPVCHTLVPKHQAVRLRVDGTTHYFCSEACADKFKPTERGGT